MPMIMMVHATIQHLQSLILFGGVMCVLLHRVVPVQACVLSCNTTLVDRCQNIEVRVRQQPVVSTYRLDFEEDSWVPIFEDRATWALDNLGITSVDLGVTRACFALAPGVSEEDAQKIAAVSLESNHISQLPYTLHEMFVDDLVWISFANNFLTSVAPNFHVGTNTLATNTIALSIMLNNNQLTSIENVIAGFSGYILNVSFSGNNITTLTENYFSSFEGENLIVNMSNNVGGLPELPAGVLGNFSGIRLGLFLDSNDITTFPTGFITTYNGSALFMSLSNNSLTELNSSHFETSGDSTSRIEQQVILRFQWNKITFLGPCLCKLFSGKTLHLLVSHNLLEDLPGPFFCENMVSRTDGVADMLIDVGYNFIRTLSPKPFAVTNPKLLTLVVAINNNLINEVPSNFLQFNDGSALTVDLSSNNISRLNSTAFTGSNVASLTLNLSNNALEEFPDLHSLSLSTLSLDLSHNRIENMGHGFKGTSPAFKANISLHHNLINTAQLLVLLTTYPMAIGDDRIAIFDVSYNIVDHLPNKSFVTPASESGASLGELTLYLSHNIITSVGVEAFQDFPGYRITVDLSYNPITSFPTQMAISQNGVVPNRVGIFNLQEMSVNLSYTGVGVEALAAFLNFTGYRFDIDVSYNNISYVGVEVAQALNNHSYIDSCTMHLHHNSITSLPQQSFLNANYLDISYNNLTVIPTGTFSRYGKSSLNGLFIGNNRITSIEYNALGQSPALYELDMSYNRITSVLIRIVLNTPNLRRGNFVGNRVIILPVTNRFFDPYDFDGNILRCETYWPFPQGCTCTSPDLKYPLEYCGYFICSETASLCPTSRPLLTSTCEMAPKLVCNASCSDKEFEFNISSQYYSSNVPINATLGCAPLTNCTLAFGVNVPSYEHTPATRTSDRACAPCSTCPSGYHKTLPCTLTSNSACATINKSGEVAAIVMGVLLAFVVTSTAWFVWGRTHQKKKRAVRQSLARKTNDLELTQGLLHTHEVKAKAHEESWKAYWGDVTVQSKIGQGAFGVVCCGTWLGTKVAVKVLKKTEAMLDRESVAFRQEMETMETLHHPHLVSFFGYGTTDKGQPFLLTELLKENLQDFLAESANKLSWLDRRRFLADIASGMLFLHTRDPPMIHRDLKSDNCLLGENNVVKVADFGTVTRPDINTSPRRASHGWSRRKSDAPGVRTSQPSTWFAMTATLGAGTPLWMAPEVLNGAKGIAHYGSPVDVYSFGICMWEIATRSIPYAGQDFNVEHFEQFITYIVDGGRPKVPRNLPSEYLSLMQTCWDGNSVARPTFGDIGKLVSSMDVNDVEDVEDVSDVVGVHDVEEVEHVDD